METKVLNFSKTASCAQEINAVLRLYAGAGIGRTKVDDHGLFLLVDRIAALRASTGDAHKIWNEILEIADTCAKYSVPPPSPPFPAPPMPYAPPLQVPPAAVPPSQFDDTPGKIVPPIPTDMWFDWKDNRFRYNNGAPVTSDANLRWIDRREEFPHQAPAAK